MIRSLRTTALLLCVGAFLATQPGASCVSDSSSDGSGKSAPSTPVDSANINDIPHRAAIVAEGRGVLDYTADADGDLYVQDVKAETVSVTHRIHRGEVVHVIPEENRVMIDQEKIYDGDLKKDHAHRLYLLRDRRFDEASQGTKKPSTVPNSAVVIGEGADKEITFKANHDGRAYLIESKSRKLIATVSLNDGERFTFSPGANRVTVDGKRVLGRDFDTTHSYRVYFDRN